MHLNKLTQKHLWSIKSKFFSIFSTTATLTWWRCYHHNLLTLPFRFKIVYYFIFAFCNWTIIKKRIWIYYIFSRIIYKRIILISIYKLFNSSKWIFIYKLPLCKLIRVFISDLKVTPDPETVLNSSTSSPFISLK